MKTVHFKIFQDDCYDDRAEFSIDGDLIELSNLYYETTDICGAIAILKFLSDKNIISISFSDKASLEYFQSYE